MAAGVEPGSREYRASYHGTGGGLFVLVFKNLLLTIVSLGCYLPWARTERRRYLWQNIEFDGHRLRYHGTGREMALGYAKVLGAYVIAIGTTFAAKQVGSLAGIVAQALVGLAFLVLIPAAIYGSQRYRLSRTSLRSVRFGLDPAAWGYTKVFIGGYLLTLLTLGLYGPVWQNRLHAFMTRNMRFGSVSFDYDGADGAAWRLSLRGFFLTLLTLGIYLPWYSASMARFRADHTCFQGARANLDLTGGQMFGLFVVSFFGTLFSMGLAFPWITTYALHFMTSRISFRGVIDYASIAARQSSGDAGADGFADALDVGLEV